MKSRSFPIQLIFLFRQQESDVNYYLTNQSSNGITTERNNDILLKQLLKNITAPQQLNGRKFELVR
jgi:hypothetical protein